MDALVSLIRSRITANENQELFFRTQELKICLKSKKITTLATLLCWETQKHIEILQACKKNKEYKRNDWIKRATKISRYLIRITNPSYFINYEIRENNDDFVLKTELDFDSGDIKLYLKGIGETMIFKNKIKTTTTTGHIIKVAVRNPYTLLNTRDIVEKSGSKTITRVKSFIDPWLNRFCPPLKGLVFQCTASTIFYRNLITSDTLEEEKIGSIEIEKTSYMYDSENKIWYKKS